MPPPIDTEEAARRLARVIVSDIQLYNGAQIGAGQDISQQIKEGFHHFVGRVAPQLHDVFHKVLAERGLAGGKASPVAAASAVRPIVAAAGREDSPTPVSLPAVPDAAGIAPPPARARRWEEGAGPERATPRVLSVVPSVSTAEPLTQEEEEEQSFADAPTAVSSSPDAPVPRQAMRTPAIPETANSPAEVAPAPAGSTASVTARNAAAPTPAPVPPAVAPTPAAIPHTAAPRPVAVPPSTTPTPVVVARSSTPTPVMVAEVRTPLSAAPSPAKLGLPGTNAAAPPPPAAKPATPSAAVVTPPGRLQPIEPVTPPPIPVPARQPRPPEPAQPGSRQPQPGFTTTAAPPAWAAEHSIPVELDSSPPGVLAILPPAAPTPILNQDITTVPQDSAAVPNLKPGFPWVRVLLALAVAVAAVGALMVMVTR